MARQYDPKIPVVGSGCKDVDGEGCRVVAGSGAVKRIIMAEHFMFHLSLSADTHSERFNSGRIFFRKPSLFYIQQRLSIVRENFG